MVYFLDQMWLALGEIAAAPFKQASVWWFLAPIILFWIILEVYFGKHKSEELGWNTALGNGMSLVWVNIESMRFLWFYKPDLFWLRFVVIFTILVYGSFIIYVSFTHKLSSKATYRLAAPSPIYYFSFISVLWGHGVLILTGWVLLDLLILYPIVLLIVFLLRKFMPGAPDDGEGKDLGLGEPTEFGEGTGAIQEPDLGDLKL